MLFRSEISETSKHCFKTLHVSSVVVVIVAVKLKRWVKHCRSQWRPSTRQTATTTNTKSARVACKDGVSVSFYVNHWGRSFEMAWAGPGRSPHVIDRSGWIGLAHGKRTVTVIAYRLFHSPAKDLRYAAAATTLTDNALHFSKPTLLISACSNVKSNIFIIETTLH